MILGDVGLATLGFPGETQIQRCCQPFLPSSPGHRQNQVIVYMGLQITTKMMLSPFIT